MTTKQPVYKCIANLGDNTPIDYGGYFVFVDTTGVYAPQAELLECPDNDDNDELYRIYRFDLDKCTFINGVLSDNPYYPDRSVWFAKYLESMGATMDRSTEEYIKLFCSDNPIDRAMAYRDVGEYFGFESLDSYPLTLTRAEVVKRYVWYHNWNRARAIIARAKGE